VDDIASVVVVVRILRGTRKIFGATLYCVNDGAGLGDYELLVEPIDYRLKIFLIDRMMRHYGRLRYTVLLAESFSSFITPVK
jgi:hypothetical protein